MNLSKLILEDILKRYDYTAILKKRIIIFVISAIACSGEKIRLRMEGSALHAVTLYATAVLM